MTNKCDKTVGFNDLPQKRQESILADRAFANEKLPQTVKDLENEIGLAFTEADGFRLVHKKGGGEMGRISHKYDGAGNVIVNNITINQSYQQYGFAALLLGLFHKDGLPKLEYLTGKGDIPRQLILELQAPEVAKIMEHVGDKYFQVTRTQTSVTNEQSDDSEEGKKTKIEVSNPDMDAIYASIAEKTQNPHMNFDNAQFIV